MESRSFIWKAIHRHTNRTQTFRYCGNTCGPWEAPKWRSIYSVTSSPSKTREDRHDLRVLAGFHVDLKVERFERDQPAHAEAPLRRAAEIQKMPAEERRFRKMNDFDPLAVRVHTLEVFMAYLLAEKMEDAPDPDMEAASWRALMTQYRQRMLAQFGQEETVPEMLEEFELMTNRILERALNHALDARGRPPQKPGSPDRS